jgi:hypothetical protein
VCRRYAQCRLGASVTAGEERATLNHSLLTTLYTTLSSKMASFESMSDIELRKKLIEYGFDIPVSGNRDFVIKKLYKLTAPEPPAKGRGGRKSTPAAVAVSSRPSNTNTTTTNNNVRNSSSSSSSRLSLNESGKYLIRVERSRG